MNFEDESEKYNSGMKQLSKDTQILKLEYFNSLYNKLSEPQQVLLLKIYQVASPQDLLPQHNKNFNEIIEKMKNAILDNVIINRKKIESMEADLEKAKNDCSSYKEEVFKLKTELNEYKKELDFVKHHTLEAPFPKSAEKSETVQITKKQWYTFECNRLELERLYMGGVDNWEWYSDAINPDDEISFDDACSMIYKKIFGEKHE